jgi:hypothetical protein
MSLWKWSQTAATNATADSTVNFQEGQAPASLNNSARALMAAVAKYRDDISGNLVMGGTATAMTLTTNQAHDTLTDGYMVRARMTETSGAAPTLNVDSRGAKAIVLDSAGTAIPTGALVDNRVYSFVYDSGADAWVVGEYFGGFLTTADNADLVAIEALVGTTGALRKTAANTWALDDGTFDAVFVIGDGVNTLTTGVKGDLHMPVACTITGAYCYADATGDLVVDVWKDTHANFPPTDADSITSATPITISSGTKASDTTLTSWTTSVAAGDVLRFNVDSVSAIKRATIVIRAKRFI